MAEGRGVNEKEREGTEKLYFILFFEEYYVY